MQRVGAYVRFGSSIPAPLNELAICMAGRKWTTQYEFYAHRRLAIEAGLALGILDAVAVGHRPDGMSTDEKTHPFDIPIVSRLMVPLLAA